MWRPRTFSTDSLGVGSRVTDRACKYYKLTSDNNGEAFRWTSNYQITSKVYLKKHSTLPLCYSLSAADVHHEKDDGTGGRVEARVCVVESCWSPIDSVISVAGVCQSLTAPRQSTT